MEEKEMNPAYRRAFRSCVYVVSAAFVFSIWVWSAESEHTSFSGDPRSTLSGLIHGTSHNPFVQRALIPIITRSLHAFLPEEDWTAFEAALLTIPKVSKEVERLKWEKGFLPEYIISLMLAFLGIVGWVFTVRALWSRLYLSSDLVTDAVPLIALIFLPPFFHVGTHYVYDFPALFFFTLGLVLMIRRDWKWFYPAFVLGCLNKETMVLLPLAFILLYSEKMDRRHLLRHAAAQVTIFTVIKILLVLHFSGNPGGVAEFHLFANIHTLLSGYTMETLLMICLFAGLTLYDLRNKHFMLRRLLWLLLPLAALVAMFALVTEARDWLEVYPLVLFLCLHTLFFTVLKIPFRALQLDAIVR